MDQPNPQEKRRGRFQNLLYGKCPYDNEKLVPGGKVSSCPACFYYVTPRKMLEILSDRNGSAWKNMTDEEREKVRSLSL